MDGARRVARRGRDPRRGHPPRAAARPDLRAGAGGRAPDAAHDARARPRRRRGRRAPRRRRPRAPIAEARDAGRELHIALAGGGTPQRAYELLAEVEGSWTHVHLWLGDERCVPDGHPESNAQMVRESLLASERAEPPVLHALPSPESPRTRPGCTGSRSRARARRRLRRHAAGHGSRRPHRSLFPGHPALAVREAPVAPRARVAQAAARARDADAAGAARARASRCCS